MTAPPREQPDSIHRTTSIDTTQLLTQAKAGDSEARDQLFLRCLPRLQAWARGRLPGYARDLADTDDLVQVSLLQAFKHIERFEPRREGAFMAYLRQILKNKILDEIRRAKPQKNRAELSEDQPGDAQSPLENILGRNILEAYEAGLEQLTEGQKEAVILRVEFGFTYREIAEATEAVSEDAARMLVVRGLARLAEVLRDHRG